MDDDQFLAAEDRRRLQQVVRYGTIAEVDYAAARVKVAIGEIRTGWLPFGAGRAGGDRSWHPPEIGEQVVVAAPGGDLAQGDVIATLFESAAPAPGNRATLNVMTYEDGASEHYDRAAHEKLIDVPAGGRIVLRVGRAAIEISDDGIRLTGPMIDLN